MNYTPLICRFLLVFTLVGALAFSAYTPVLRPVSQPQPLYNILFIAIDDMNNWVGALGGPAQTPNIDRLARKGRLFTNAYCVFPACNPSRTAIMTGQRPETTGQFSNEGNFRDKPGGITRQTLPQFLQKQGYETYAAGKIYHNPHGTGTTPNPQSDPASWTYQNPGQTGTPGHNLFLDEYGQANWLGLPPPADRKTVPYLTKFGVWGAIPQKKEACGDWQMAGYCADFLRQKHDKNFFLACGIFRPHSPQLAPQEYFDKYPLDKITLPPVAADDMDDIPAIAQTNFASSFVEQVRAKGQLKKAMQGYLASMSFADDCVGRVVDALEKSQYANNTVVVFYTDHGWQLGQKNRWEKYSLWKQGTNSPLIIYYPGIKQAGQSCDQAVSLMDLYPTVLDLLKQPKPAFLEGRSLVEQLQNPRAKRDVPAVVTYPDGNYSVVLNEWDYILYQDGSEELYNHKTDPNEFNNVASRVENQAIKTQLKPWIPKKADKKL